MQPTDATQSATHEYALSVGLRPVPLQTAYVAAMLCLYSKHVCLLVSETGIGKTAMLRKIAEQNELDFILFPLACREPTDITGPMLPTADGKSYSYLPDSRIPLAGFENADKPALLAFDEVNRAPKSTLNPVFPVWVERILGVHELGENVYVIAAMNPPTGEYAVTTQFSTDPAMRRRTCQVVVDLSVTEWLRWAKEPARRVAAVLPPLSEVPDVKPGRPIHPCVVEYIQSDRSALLDRDARDSNKVFSCPANLEFVSDTFYVVEQLRLNTDDPLIAAGLFAKIAGHIGQTRAKVIIDQFTKHASSIDPRDILSNLHNPKSSIRAKLERLVESGRAAEIAGALNNLAVVWVEGANTGAYEYEKSAKSLAPLFEICPMDVCGSFFDALVIAGRENPPSDVSRDVVMELTSRLHEEPVFRAYIAKKRAAETEHRGELANMEEGAAEAQRRAAS